MKPEQKPNNQVRAVIDTNVIVSGLNFPGNPFQILELAREGKINIYLSPFIFGEVERVLRDKFRWPTSDLENILALLQKWATLVQPEITVDAIQRDDTDNRILECALACQAHYIVTGDSDIRALGEFRGIRIVNAAEFLSIYT